MPTFLGDKLPSWWGKAFSSKGISLGLDLEGGIFLLLGVETEKGVNQEMLIVEEAPCLEVRGKQDSGKKLVRF